MIQALKPETQRLPVAARTGFLDSGNTTLDRYPEAVDQAVAKYSAKYPYTTFAKRAP